MPAPSFDCAGVGGWYKNNFFKNTICCRIFGTSRFLTGCRDTAIGNTYRGRHFRTKTGILCQRWDQQSPHQHPFTNTSMFPDPSMDELSNYCRNPDQSSDGPWCFTMDPAIERQSCGIPMCSGYLYRKAGI